MQPLSLRIRNIGPYKDESIDLSGIPGSLIAICGLNGEGKTMMLESIFAGAYRSFPSRPDGIYKYCTERDAGIEFGFMMGGKNYHTFINLDSKTRKMEAVLALDGQPLNDGKTGTFDEKIVKILGSSERILASSFGCQEKAGNFIKLQKIDRKNLFITMIGLSLLQEISEAGKGRGDSYSPRKDKLSGQVEILRQTAARPLPDIDPVKDKIIIGRQKLKDCQSDLDEKARNVVLMGTRQERLPELSKQKTLAMCDYSDYTNAKVSSEESLRTAKDGVVRLPGLRNELSQVKQTASDMREQLITLREKCSRITGLEAQVSTSRTTVNRLGIELDKAENELKKQTSLASGLASLREKQETLNRIRGEEEESSRTLRQLNSEMMTIIQADEERAAIVLDLTKKTNLSTNQEAAAQKLYEDAKRGAEFLKEVPCRGVGEYAECQFLTEAVEKAGKIDQYMSEIDNAKAMTLAHKQAKDLLPKRDEGDKVRMRTQIGKLNKEVSEARQYRRRQQKVPAELDGPVRRLGEKARWLMEQ